MLGAQIPETFPDNYPGHPPRPFNIHWRFYGRQDAYSMGQRRRHVSDEHSWQEKLSYEGELLLNGQGPAIADRV
jgi:hypothetical protein